MRKLFWIFLVFSFALKAQPPLNFQALYGWSGDDLGFSVKVTLDSHYVIAGSTSSFGDGNTDVLLFKLLNTGQGAWTKNIGGPGIDIAKGVVQLPDSGFVLAGYTNSFGNGGFDVYVARTDKAGNLKWQKTFGGTDWDFATDVLYMPNGEIYVSGYTESFGKEQEALVLRYDTLGLLKGQLIFGGSKNDRLVALTKTIDSKIAVVGITESRKDPDGDGLFVKLGLNLDTLFVKSFGGPASDAFSDIIQKQTGEYVICGGMTYSTSSFMQSGMYGFNSVGDSLWENHYTATPGNEKFVSVADSKLTSTLTAFVRNVPVPNSALQGNIFVAAPGGWAYKIKSVGGFADDFVYAIEATPDGGFIGVGESQSYNSVGKDVFVIKLDSTIINYSHIEAVDEIKSLDNELLVKKEPDGTVLVLDKTGQMNYVDVITLAGQKVYRGYFESGKAELQIEAMDNNLLILDVVFINGSHLHRKYQLR